MELGKAYVKNQSYENLYNYEEALLKGNLFKDLYDPYIYENTPFTNLSKENRVLYLIMQYMFVYTDLNLYLDIYPDDKKALNDFDLVTLELEKLINYYQRNYHTIINYSNYNDDKFDWSTSSWPWEVGY